MRVTYGVDCYMIYIFRIWGLSQSTDLVVLLLLSDMLSDLDLDLSCWIDP